MDTTVASGEGDASMPFGPIDFGEDVSPGAIKPTAADIGEPARD